MRGPQLLRRWQLLRSPQLLRDPQGLERQRWNGSAVASAVVDRRAVVFRLRRIVVASAVVARGSPVGHEDDQATLHEVLEVVHHEPAGFEEGQQVLCAERIDQVFDGPVTVK